MADNSHLGNDSAPQFAPLPLAAAGVSGPTRRSRFTILNDFVDRGQVHLRKLGCGSAASLWFSIWRFANAETDAARVALDTLANCYGTDKRNVVRMIDQLEHHGYLVTLEQGKPGRGSCAVYRLLVPDVSEEKVSPAHLSGMGKGVVETPFRSNGKGVVETPIEPEKVSPERGKGVTSTPVQKQKEDKTPLPPAEPGGGAGDGRKRRRRRGEMPGDSHEARQRHHKLFASLIDRYPKNRDRDEAQAAFADALEAGAFTADNFELVVMRPLLRQREADPQWQRENRRYVPKLSKWIKNRDWENWAAPATAVAAKRPVDFPRMAPRVHS